MVPGAARDPVEVHVRRDDVRRASETIGPEAAVVEYWLGEKTSYAWLVTKGRIQMTELGETTRIDAAARALIAAMRDFTRVPLPERMGRARALSALILAPLPAEFRSARRVYFVPDGALHGVPFAALPADARLDEPLVAKREVAVAATLGSIEDDRMPISLGPDVPFLLVADPVYSRDDARVAPARETQRHGLSSRGGALVPDSGWTRLEGSGREAAAIGKIVPGAQTLVGFAANRDALLRRNLRGLRVLHFATHAVADLESPALSTLVLSTLDEHGAARVGEVFAGDLLYPGSSTPTSSCSVVAKPRSASRRPAKACSGCGTPRTRPAARTVIASLWPVVDLVGEFLNDRVLCRNETRAPAAGRGALPGDAGARAQPLARSPRSGPCSRCRESRAARICTSYRTYHGERRRQPGEQNATCHLTTIANGEIHG